MKTIVEQVQDEFQRIFNWPKNLVTDVVTVNFWLSKGWQLEDFVMYFDFIIKDKKQLAWLTAVPARMNLSSVLNINANSVRHIEDTVMALKWKKNAAATRVIPEKEKKTIYCRDASHWIPSDAKYCAACIRAGNLIEIMCNPKMADLAPEDVRAKWDFASLVKKPEESGPEYVTRTYPMRKEIYDTLGIKINPLWKQVEIVRFELNAKAS